jgi:hypothetical protein
MLNDRPKDRPLCFVRLAFEIFPKALGDLRFHFEANVRGVGVRFMVAKTTC